MVGLGPVVALIETLVAAGDGNALVTSQKPSLLEKARVRSPDLDTFVVVTASTSIQSEVSAVKDNTAGPRVDIPSLGLITAYSDDLNAVAVVVAVRG